MSILKSKIGTLVATGATAASLLFTGALPASADIGVNRVTASTEASPEARACGCKKIVPIYDKDWKIIGYKEVPA